jgi:IS30 family transposase
MDKTYSITELQERKRGQHLRAEERGAIQCLKRLGFSNRAIARER